MKRHCLWHTYTCWYFERRCCIGTGRHWHWHCQDEPRDITSDEQEDVLDENGRVLSDWAPYFSFLSNPLKGMSWRD